MTMESLADYMRRRAAECDTTISGIINKSDRDDEVIRILGTRRNLYLELLRIIERREFPS